MTGTPYSAAPHHRAAALISASREYGFAGIPTARSYHPEDVCWTYLGGTLIMEIFEIELIQVSWAVLAC